MTQDERYNKKQVNIYRYIENVSGIKKFAIPCNFSGNLINITILMSDGYRKGVLPMHFQQKYIESKGGQFAQETIDGIKKLQEVAERNRVSFVDLCMYSLKLAQED